MQQEKRDKLPLTCSIRACATRMKTNGTIEWGIEAGFVERFLFQVEKQSGRPSLSASGHFMLIEKVQVSISGAAWLGGKTNTARKNLAVRFSALAQPHALAKHTEQDHTQRLGIKIPQPFCLVFLVLEIKKRRRMTKQLCVLILCLHFGLLHWVGHEDRRRTEMNTTLRK